MGVEVEFGVDSGGFICVRNIRVYRDCVIEEIIYWGVIDML